MSMTVTNDADDGTGSLRQAIARVCSGGTITFDAGYTIHVLSTLTIDKSLTIDGSGHTVTISGDNARQVFSIQSSGVVTLRHLTIANGLTSSSDGGGINNAGWLALVDCTMTGNTARIGSAIYNTGTLSVKDSTISGNTASAGGAGGGIFNNSGGTATIENSRLTGNSADDGGAVYNNTTTSHLTITGSTVSGNTATGSYGTGGGLTNTGQLTIRASTVTGNSTTYQGGGVANMAGTVNIENSTVTGNSASSQGGGVYNSSGMTANVLNSTITDNRAAIRGGGVDNHGTMKLVNTIVANSPAGGDCRNSFTITADHTLMEESGANACDQINGVNGNIIGYDPLVGSLGNYGGSTQTHNLLPGSPALDAGSSCLATDQRGIPRPQPTGGACDIGAFEANGDHTVTFNANGGTGSMANQVTNLPTALTANTFTRTGYSFSGWNSAANGIGTAYADGVVYNFLADITLYAQWTVVPPAAFGKSNPTDAATNISIAPTLSWSASSSQTDYEFCYDTASSGACAGTWTSTGNTTSATLSGLSYTTTYRWQARAVNLGVYTYADGGVMWSFTTGKQAPAVNTGLAATVTTDSATLNGTVNAWNDSTVVTFEYGTTTAYGTTVTAAGSPVTGSTNTAVSYALGGLLPNTTYHYRVVGQNSTATSYGVDRTFKTAAMSVVITTEIHNAAHVVVTSAALGDSLHTSATVTGSGSMAVTGTVTFTAFDNPACSGTGTNAGTVTLAAAVAEPSLSATLTDNGLSFRAHYDGDTHYPAADGECISIFTSPYPTVLTLSANALPQDGATLTASPANLLVQFSQDILHGSATDPDSAEYPANYLLVAQGVNGVFDTISCGPAGTGGLQPDDTQISVNAASYNPATYIARLTVNGGKRLPNGEYRLFVCGTTSISNPTRTIYLNNHTADSVATFTVAATSSSGSGSGGEESDSKKLPATGFAPDAVTVLPIQPAEKAYSDEALSLEIPALDLKQPIVGVPGPDWDVTWLGNQIGYLQGTAFPTWDGNSVLTGHATNANGKAGPFASLGTLTWGDHIIIRAWGQVYIYEVRAVNLWTDPGSTGILTRHETLPWLTLITCRGYDEETNTYRWRTVVRAVLVEIK
jgi:LPXTG-site transpeptidase (sortase) family protein